MKSLGKGKAEMIKIIFFSFRQELDIIILYIVKVWHFLFKNTTTYHINKYKGDNVYKPETQYHFTFKANSEVTFQEKCIDWMPSYQLIERYWDHEE